LVMPDGVVAYQDCGVFLHNVNTSLAEAGFLIKMNKLSYESIYREHPGIFAEFCR
jgi:hypothetical protein